MANEGKVAYGTPPIRCSRVTVKTWSVQPASKSAWGGEVIAG